MSGTTVASNSKHTPSPNGCGSYGIQVSYGISSDEVMSVQTNWNQNSCGACPEADFIRSLEV